MRTGSPSPSISLGNVPRYKWFLSLVMVAILALGWKFPLLGLAVPVVMLTGILGGLVRGRWTCGNLCPRGSFLDTWMKLASAHREMPALLRSTGFRWTTLAGLMGFMVFRLAQDAGSLQHWGLVFWQMCLLTTAVAIALGLRYVPRSWCSVCPVGTLAGSLGGGKYPLQIHASCKSCGVCESRCPMGLQIVRHRDRGVVAEKDCLKCSACVTACPRADVLRWPMKEAA